VVHKYGKPTWPVYASIEVSSKTLRRTTSLTDLLLSPVYRDTSYSLVTPIGTP